MAKLIQNDLKCPKTMFLKKKIFQIFDEFFLYDGIIGECFNYFSWIQHEI